MTSLVGSTVDVSLRLLVTSLRANQRLPFFLVNNKKSAFRVSRKKPADMEPFEPTMKQLLADVVGVETLCWDDVNCLGDYRQLAMAPPPPSASAPPPPPAPAAAAHDDGDVDDDDASGFLRSAGPVDQSGASFREILSKID